MATVLLRPGRWQPCCCDRAGGDRVAATGPSRRSCAAASRGSTATRLAPSPTSAVALPALPEGRRCCSGALQAVVVAAPRWRHAA
eukprot:358881-Chlamydomonas_euryale.AAC.3